MCSLDVVKDSQMVGIAAVAHNWQVAVQILEQQEQILEYCSADIGIVFTYYVTLLLTDYHDAHSMLGL